MRQLLELIAGQNNLNYLQSKIFAGEVSELCRFCKEEDKTFEHLINECPCFNSYRRDVLFLTRRALSRLGKPTGI